MYRQGDLLIVVGTVPEHVEREVSRLVKDGVVERGEATGHAHRLVGGEVWASDSGPYLRTDGTAQLTHDEHDTIVLPEGEYRVIRQREFSVGGDWSYVDD